MVEDSTTKNLLVLFNSLITVLLSELQNYVYREDRETTKVWKTSPEAGKRPNASHSVGLSVQGDERSGYLWIYCEDMFCHLPWSLLTSKCLGLEGGPQF